MCPQGIHESNLSDVPTTHHSQTPATSVILHELCTLSETQRKPATTNERDGTNIIVLPPWLQQCSDHRLKIKILITLEAIIGMNIAQMVSELQCISKFCSPQIPSLCP